MLTVFQEAYRALGASRGFGSIEYGYYYANIHYYLFEDCSEFERNDAYKASVNKRTKYFLENAESVELMEKGWFPLNFPADYLGFLEVFYGNHRKESSEGVMGPFTNLKTLVERYDNKVEKKIVELARPIIEECHDRK